MYKIFELENTSVLLKDEFHNNNSWSVYPNKWRVRRIILGNDPGCNGRSRYGDCDSIIYGANMMKQHPLKFELYQPFQMKDGKFLPSTMIMASPENCVIDDEFKNQIMDMSMFTLFHSSEVDKEVNKHIVDILNGDNSFITKVADEEIKFAKKLFKDDTGFDFDTFKDIRDYYKTIKTDVDNFITKINPYVKKKIGKTLIIQYDPLHGDWVTSQNYGEVRMDLSEFWQDIIHWNRTHEPKDMRGLRYKKNLDPTNYEYGELDIKKFFKK